MLFSFGELRCKNMNEIWTTGITVKNSEYGWIASCKLRYVETIKSGCMEGTITTKYFEKSLSEAIDYVLHSMKQMNVKRSDEIKEMNDILGFALYYDDESIEDLTDELKEEIKIEADKRGWKCYIGE